MIRWSQRKRIDYIIVLINMCWWGMTIFAKNIASINVCQRTGKLRLNRRLLKVIKKIVIGLGFETGTGPAQHRSRGGGFLTNWAILVNQHTISKILNKFVNVNISNFNVHVAMQNIFISQIFIFVRKITRSEQMLNVYHLHMRLHSRLIIVEE